MPHDVGGPKPVLISHRYFWRIMSAGNHTHSNEVICGTRKVVGSRDENAGPKRSFDRHWSLLHARLREPFKELAISASRLGKK